MKRIEKKNLEKSKRKLEKLEKSKARLKRLKLRKGMKKKKYEARCEVEEEIGKYIDYVGPRDVVKEPPRFNKVPKETAVKKQQKIQIAGSDGRKKWKHLPAAERHSIEKQRNNAIQLYRQQKINKQNQT